MTRAEAPTSPRECALAVGLPLTPEEFFEQLRPADERDFAKHVKRSNFVPGTSDDYYWEQVYAPVARKLQNTCDRAAGKGAQVVDRATLASLAGLFSRSKVVTIVGHWRFMPFVPEDIVDFPALLQAMSSPATPLRERLSIALQRRLPTLPEPKDEASCREILDGINETIRAAHEWYHQEDERSSPPREPTIEDLQRLTRPAFEQALPGILRAGRAIELAEGLHTIKEVADSIDEFDGLVDLTICNSVILGSAVKREHPECTVAVIRYPADIRIRAVLYDLTLDRLARKRSSFMAAMAFVHG